MTEPMIGGGDLRPLVTLFFRKRFQILGLFLVATIGTYAFLKIIKFTSYQAASVVMVKTPLVDFDGRIDPNPQVAPAYLDLARSDGLLADTHRLFTEMRELAEPIAKELGIEEFVDRDLREGWLPALRKKEGLEDRLAETAQQLPLDWQRPIFSDLEMFLALFEVSPKDADKFDLEKFQLSFRVKADIANHTNVYILNEPFIQLSVQWNTVGGSALWANLWGRLFVDRVNALIQETGASTEASILGEAAKVVQEFDDLSAELAQRRATPEYQKLLEVQGLENSLYGGRTELDMFGYVEFHANLSQESGLVGALSGQRLKAAEAAGEAKSLEQALAQLDPASAEVRDELTDQALWADLHAKQAAVEVAEMAAEIEKLSARAKTLREEIAEFEAEYRAIEFQVEQGQRLFSEKLTTSIFTRSRLKAGYSIPPMVFVERAIPSKKPAGMKKSVMGLAVGTLLTLFYLCLVIYRGYVVPVVGTLAKEEAAT